MIHPDTELRFVNEVIGYGVFATRPIPKGTITWALDELDRVYTPKQLRQHDEPYLQILDKYAFVNSRGMSILCWDLAKYMNHSCNPSCLGPYEGYEISVRDIEAGEELTDDYGTLNILDPFPCACGEPNCRHIILPDDLLRHSDRWDAAIREALPHITEIAQPLRWLVGNEGELEAAWSNVETLRSVRLNFYDANACGHELL